MTLTVKSTLQIMDHSGGRPKFHDLEPGTYTGRVGPPPPKHDESSAWFYINGHNSIGAALDYLRNLPNDRAELVDT